MAKKKIVAASTLETLVKPEGMLVPSGVTLLDLACTDSPDGFCSAGHGVNIIGDRDVGKTILAVASQAETYRRHGDKFVYDFYDAENAYSFKTAELFGSKFAGALNVYPVKQDVEWCTEALAHKISDSLNDGKPHFIVIDSMDLLHPRKEYDNVENLLNGKKGISPHGAANKYFFRVLIPKIAETGSFLIYLSQATVNIGFGAMFNPKIRGGGSSLGFNAYVELWLSQGPAIKVGDTKVGHWVFARTARSKANGKKRDVSFPILPAYGIDDTRANIEWLVEEKAVPCERNVYDLNPIGIEYTGKDPYLFVEESGMTGKIVDIVRGRWAANEQECVDKALGGRKRRYE